MRLDGPFLLRAKIEKKVQAASRAVRSSVVHRARASNLKAREVFWSRVEMGRRARFLRHYSRWTSHTKRGSHVQRCVLQQIDETRQTACCRACREGLSLLHSHFYHMSPPQTNLISAGIVLGRVQRSMHGTTYKGNWRSVVMRTVAQRVNAADTTTRNLRAADRYHCNVPRSGFQ